MDEERGVLPQLTTPSDAVITSVEWLFEPAWRGDRLMARARDGRVTLTDRTGEPAGPELDEAAEVLAPAIDADDALVDGVWTSMPFLGENSAARHLADAIAEEGLEDELPDPMETEPRRAFVAIDLVELDGQSLEEVPYLERRRLLSSVVAEDVRVRVTPAVRNPVASWLHAWRANGFTHYVAKHVNSRYHPGEIAEDWLECSVSERRGPSAMGRLVGARPKKVARIHDERPDPQDRQDRQDR
jgi:bifunctional non-homologous end joining protein LigD